MPHVYLYSLTKLVSFTVEEELYRYRAVFDRSAICYAPHLRVIWVKDLYLKSAAKPSKVNTWKELTVDLSIYFTEILFEVK